MTGTPAGVAVGGGGGGGGSAGLSTATGWVGATVQAFHGDPQSEGTPLIPQIGVEHHIRARGACRGRGCRVGQSGQKARPPGAGHLQVSPLECSMPRVVLTFLHPPSRCCCSLPPPCDACVPRRSTERSGRCSRFLVTSQAH